MKKDRVKIGTGSLASEITIYRRGGWLFHGESGLTWGYNVSLSSDAAKNSGFLAHETAHVAQQTQLYGVAGFYTRYAGEIAKGYGIRFRNELERPIYENIGPFYWE
jgi:hypothetical protein